MKVQTEKKQLPKWVKPAGIGAIALVIVIVIAVVVSSSKPKTDFYNVVDNFISQEECNFRYILNVRSEDHKEGVSADLENYMNDASFSEEGSAPVNEYEPEEEATTEGGRTQTGNLYGEYINQEWGTATGKEVVDWSYPNYEISITGRCESVDPLQCAIKIGVSTEFIDADFCSIVFIDGKTYIDIQTLRNWLIKAGDGNLVALADQIPDNTVYIEMEDNSYRFINSYGEASEEFSGAQGFTDFYRRFIVMEKIISSGLKNGMGEAGLTSEEGKCRISLADDSAYKLMQVVGSMLNTSGNGYDNYVSSLEKNEIADENEVKQLKAEKDNFLSDMSDLWADFNNLSEEEIRAMDLNVIGKTHTYNASTGGAVIELNLGASYIMDNKDYVITLYGCKQELSIQSPIEVKVPEETVVPYATLKNEYPLEGVLDYLLYYFHYNTDINGDRLNINLEQIESNLLEDFVVLVNETNSGINGGIIRQDLFSIKDYITRYASLSETDRETNEVTKVNYELVRTFLDNLNALGTVEEIVVEGSKYEPKTVLTTVDGVSITGEVSEMDSNSQLYVLDMTFSNTTNKEKSVDFSKWYVLDENGNKYPVNNETQLKSMNANFDLSAVSKGVKLGGFSDEKLLEIIGKTEEEIKEMAEAEAQKKAEEIAKEQGVDIEEVEVPEPRPVEELIAELRDNLTSEQQSKAGLQKAKFYIVISGDHQLTLYNDKGEIGIIRG